MSETNDRIERAVRDFLSSAPIESSSVILDGPGIGCTSHTMVLGYLGIERLLKLGEMHSFSSSAYGTMFFLARHLRMLTLDKAKVRGWNRENQKRHKLTLPGQFLLAMPSVLTKGYLFSHDLTLAALEYSVSPEFVRLQLKDIPPCFHFWIYNKTDNRLEDLHAGNALFGNWTMGDIIRAAVSIPYIYQPFEKDGKTLRDPMFAPTIRQALGNLRQGKNVLFWSMKYSAKKGNLLAVKGHESSNGLRRIILDEVKFLLGVDNPEFDAWIEKGVFDTTPLK
jgi:hypothetical protein